MQSKSLKQLVNWFKYSGASASITVNPYHWCWMPVVRINPENNEWTVGPDKRNFYASWLFLTVRIWIDNGRW